MEYSLIKNNRVVNIVMSSRPIDELQNLYEGYEIRPVENTPMFMLQSYQYWNERP